MKKLIAIVWLLLPYSAIAETAIICPEAYPTSLLIAKGVPAGWKGIAHVPGSRMVLRSAGVIVGPPKDYAQGLLHGRETKTKNGFTVKFADLNNFVERLEKWAYCAYGIGHDVQLLQRLPDKTDVCVADFTNTPYNGYDIRMTCH